jgi:ligand-binding sensor domain-containing protein
LPGDFVTSFLETASGNIWIGTTGGLAKFENGGFKTFTAADGLAGSFVRSLYLTLADKHQ